LSPLRNGGDTVFREMRLVITCEHRFERLADGTVWTADVFPYAFWQPYLDVFDEVRVVARVRDVRATATDASGARADGPRVSFYAVPYYVGPRQFIAKLFPIRRAMRQASTSDDAIILRGFQLARMLRSVIGDQQPYGCEVIGDPHDVFARGVVEHPLRPLFRWWYARELRRQCLRASAALYVTRDYLQSRYPSPGPMFSASDVQLIDEAFVAGPRRFDGATPFRLITVGTLDQLYKGQDVAIRALAELVRRGRDVRLTFVGKGRLRPRLEALASSEGVASRIAFTGPLPAGHAVREQLDQSDLFIMPSRTEGLPRALLEAMARGLPCIASGVGGVPELLDAEDLAVPGNVSSLADAIEQAMQNPERLCRMSVRNLQRAQRYTQSRMTEVRRRFYEAVRDATARRKTTA